MHEVVPGTSVVAAQIQSILDGRTVVSVRQVVYNHSLLAKVRQFTKAQLHEYNVCIDWSARFGSLSAPHFTASFSLVLRRVVR